MKILELLLNLRSISLAAIGVVGAAGLLGGCADDPEPVAFSEAISIELGGIKEGEVRDGQASEDKKVNDESGNPYRAFLDTARARLDGHDPSAIAVTSADLRLRSDTTGVNGFEEVFESMELFLDDDSTTIPVGTVANPSGTSVSVPITATADDLMALQDTLLTDHVRVGVRGPTVDSPPSSFDLRITVDIVFEALP